MLSHEEKTKVTILTGHYRVEGDIALASGSRVTDYIVNAKDFIAVTDATVTNNDGRPILMSPFLNIHRTRIEIIMPADTVKII